MLRVKEPNSKSDFSKAIASLKLGPVPLESYVSLLAVRKKRFVVEKQFLSRFSGKLLKFGTQNTLLSVTKDWSLRGYERKLKKLSNFPIF